MKQLLASLAENADRSSRILHELTEDLTAIKIRQVFFLSLLNGLQKTHTENGPFWPQDSGFEVYFLKDGEKVLVSELEPPNRIQQGLQRVSLQEIDQKKMKGGNLGYVLQTCKYRHLGGREKRKFLISFETRRWEALDYEPVSYHHVD